MKIVYMYFWEYVVFSRRCSDFQDRPTLVGSIFCNCPPTLPNRFVVRIGIIGIFLGALQFVTDL